MDDCEDTINIPDNRLKEVIAENEILKENLRMMTEHFEIFRKTAQAEVDKLKKDNTTLVV